MVYENQMYFQGQNNTSPRKFLGSTFEAKVAPARRPNLWDLLSHVRLHWLTRHGFYPQKVHETDKHSENAQTDKKSFNYWRHVIKYRVRVGRQGWDDLGSNRFGGHGRATAVGYKVSSYESNCRHHAGRA